MKINENPSVLVISAHAVDFVWRCAGTIAHYSKNGSIVRILDLTFGEKGESADIWRRHDNITLEEVKELRKAEAQKCANILGAEIRFLDFGDHPLVMNEERYLLLVEEMRELQPKIVLTHFKEDPLNPDHPETSAATIKALRYARVPGVKPKKKVISVVKTFMFEPDQPEFCNFKPDVFIDITEVMHLKEKAMKTIKSQAFLIKNYYQRAEYRGYLASRISGNVNIKFAEAFERFSPYVGTNFV